MLVVADTSALLALVACDGLNFLDALFAEVRVPVAVWRECTIEGKAHAESLSTYLSDKIVEIDLNDYVIAAPGLGAGELEAMALYKHLHADRLLLDDSRARKIAKINAISVVGSLGVLLLAKERGLIDLLKPRLVAIEDAGIFLSADLAAEVLRLASEA